MAKPLKTIDSFFKIKFDKTVDDAPSASNLDVSACNLDVSVDDQHPPKSPKVEHTEVDRTFLERDPGLCRQIWEYPPDQCDEIRRAYIKAGPYQFILSQYPRSASETHPRQFQSSWFQSFPSWLEYSPTKDVAYCLPCFLFAKKLPMRSGSNAFISEGFRNWKKVKGGNNGSFLTHVGEDPCSSHKITEQCCLDLMNQPCHIDKVLERQTLEQIAHNRLRLNTSIDVVRWLTCQGQAFRGHDERPESSNKGNFIEMIKILATYKDEIAKVVLENAPKNAQYTSPEIQKEILHIIARKVRRKIREDIGDTKLCILVDEARDKSKKEQMVLVLRYVDKDGVLQERFFDRVHVKDTTSLTLKKELSAVLSRHNLSVHNLRGQGYDGASNMRGQWNGLQTLFLNDCPYAYYVHCLAYPLQLALVVASREVIHVHQFFSKLNFIVNIIGASCKRNDELQSAQAIEIEHLIALGELETGRGANQIGTLQRPGDTRWSSHFDYVCSMIRLFGATCSVLEDIIEDRSSNFSTRGDVDAAHDSLTSF